MYSIGEFAKKCGTSPKTIRFYDKTGVLKANYVSPSSGYRFYTDDALERYRAIEALKAAGFTLREIKAYLQNNQDGTAADLLMRKIEALQKQIDACNKLMKEPFMETLTVQMRTPQVDIKDCGSTQKIAIAKGPRRIEFIAPLETAELVADKIDRGLDDEKSFVQHDFDLLAAICDGREVRNCRHDEFTDVCREELREALCAADEEMKRGEILHITVSCEIQAEAAAELINLEHELLRKRVLANELTFAIEVSAESQPMIQIDRIVFE